MTASPPRLGPRWLTAGQGTARGSRDGVVSGYLFKLIRESIPLTQEELSERLAVDKPTVQGWESGRRSPAATRSGKLVALRYRLIQLGAHTALVDALPTAMEADFLLSHALAVKPDEVSVDEHPLSGWVLTRPVAAMLAW